jgi:hypothetical protein
MTTSRLDLRDAWADLLRRRSAFADTLAIYGRVFDDWAETDADVSELAWSDAESRSRWARGIPLLAEASPALDAAALEEPVSHAIELIGAVRSDTASGLGRFAGAWDAGVITPASLFPGSGRVGTVDASVGLGPEVIAFIAVAILRPRLERYFARCRGHLSEADWGLGVCPFCGAPPGFADVIDDGRRRLACHVCGGAWVFPRLRCPFCGDEQTKNLGRLDFEERSDQGYFISTCVSCRGYLKEIDRRVRWNGGPALIEDWGSPHFDVACGRAGYVRPVAPVILAGRVSPR